MAFNELKNQSEMVQEETRAYVESTFAYYKLWGFKIAMKSTTMAIKAVLIVLCIIMVFLFGSVAAALAIGQALASNALGFLIVGGIYLLILLILILLKDKIVDGPILRKFSEIFFND
jgi:uncharacterized membrane protein YdbT with pleckstrin-like domain